MALALAVQARRALGRTVRWERRTIGVTGFISRPIRSRLRRLLGMGALQDARRFTRRTLEELFDALHRGNAGYVVLRWFDGLPGRADGDIDFLVADDSLAQFEALLDGAGDGVPCDLYSASGTEGYRYAGLPYFPPLLAERILARRTTAVGQVSVPCPEDHFFSLAYHALYQKGLRSGLPTELPSLRPVAAPMHDYIGTLTELAATLRYPVEISMEGLDAFLSDRGWRPSAAMLKQLARHNEWAREYFYGQGSTVPGARGILADG